jgi:hypothetical protein
MASGTDRGGGSVGPMLPIVPAHWQRGGYSLRIDTSAGIRLWVGRGSAPPGRTGSSGPSPLPSIVAFARDSAGELPQKSSTITYSRYREAVLQRPLEPKSGGGFVLCGQVISRAMQRSGRVKSLRPTVWAQFRHNAPIRPHCWE